MTSQYGKDSPDRLVVECESVVAALTSGASNFLSRKVKAVAEAEGLIVVAMPYIQDLEASV